MAQGINFRKLAIKTAKELGYNGAYIKLIKEAKSEDEVEHIMVTARKEMEEAEDKHFAW